MPSQSSSKLAAAATPSAAPTAAVISRSTTPGAFAAADGLCPAIRRERPAACAVLL